MAPHLTIKDIAQAVGMSVPTVSGVLNHREGFSETTRKRVWDIAHSMNYVPNSQARKLRCGEVAEARRRTRILMHISLYGRPSLIGDLFEAERALMLEYEAQEQDYFMLNYWYSSKRGFRCPPLLDRLIDGVVLGCPHTEVINAILGKVPTVLMDVSADPAEMKLPVVNPDIAKGWRAILRQAYAQGHRRALWVQHYNADNGQLYDMYGRGIADACAEFGIEFIHERHKITVANFEKLLDQSAASVPERIRRDKIDLLLVPNIAASSGLFRRLTAAGLKLPDDIGLATANYAIGNPLGLTCLGYDWLAIAKCVVAVLDELIGGKSELREYLIDPIIDYGTTM